MIVLIVVVLVVVNVMASIAAERHPAFARIWLGVVTLMSIYLFIDALSARNWVGVVFWGILTVLNFLSWWDNWRKRKRRKANSLVGAKSKAIRDALVRKVRESTKPRQVLRPVPGGAR